MLVTDAFYLIAALTVISSIIIFFQKKLIYSVVALASVFSASALLFFLLGQTIIAALQLIVFVGGLSTYLIVAIATEQKNSKLVKMPVLGIAALAMFAALSVVIGYLRSSPTSSVPNFLSSATLAFSANYALFYVMAALLFATVICGVLIIKKFSKLLV